MLNEFLKKEAPIHGLAGMGGGVPSRLLTLAADTTTYIEDVFSTDLWKGNSTTQTITNGIDLSGDGGLVWIKSRNDTWAHALFDTERGAGFELDSSSTGAHDSDTQVSSQKDLYQFNSNGYSIGQNYNSYINANGDDFVGWTFRKCPGFFDIVTFTSNNSSSGVSVSHSLGSTPGMIIVKSTNVSSTDWWVWHNSAPVDSGSPPSGVPAGSRKIGKLNSLERFDNSTNIINSVTSTSFNYGNNGAGYNDDTSTTFVAYVFAHNDGSFGEDEDEAVIKCGGYTGNGTNGHEINVGFEPQYVLIKNSGDNGNWYIMDIMRGAPASRGSTDGSWLSPNRNDTEGTLQNYAVWPTPTGFKIWDTGGSFNGNNETYVYMAIRRPHKPPEDATDVFAIDTKSVKSGSTGSYTTNFIVDFALRRNNINSINSTFVFTRLTAKNRLLTDSTAGDTTDSSFDDHFRFNNGYGDFSSADSNDYGYFFKRAKGFFDVVVYDGSALAQNINHNLGVAPELIITKRRDTTSSIGWIVSSYHYFVSTRWDRNGRLNQDVGLVGGGVYEPASSHSATQYPVNTTSDVNTSGGTYVALLFASLDGISKVGSYSGSSSDVTVDCGFTNGARFLLIKRANGDGEWFVYDSTRGLTANTDPYFRLNNTAAQATESENWVESHSSGFKVNSTAPSDLNGSGNTYLFLAIA